MDNMKLSELFPGSVGLCTTKMAALLNRKPQTLRRWAAFENGPLRPVRINGRLLWLLKDAQLMLDRTQPDFLTRPAPRATFR